MGHYEDGYDRMEEENRLHRQQLKQSRIDRMMKKLGSEDTSTRKLLEVIDDEYYDQFK